MTRARQFHRGYFSDRCKGKPIRLACPFCGGSRMFLSEAEFKRWKSKWRRDHGTWVPMLGCSACCRFSDAESWECA